MFIVWEISVGAVVIKTESFGVVVVPPGQVFAEGKGDGKKKKKTRSTIV